VCVNAPTADNVQASSRRKKTKTSQLKFPPVYIFQMLCPKGDQWCHRRSLWGCDFHIICAEAAFLHDPKTFLEFYPNLRGQTLTQYINTRNSRTHEVPLVTACASNKVAAVKFLVMQRGADVEQAGDVARKYAFRSDVGEMTALGCAAGNGNLELAKFLITKGKARVGGTTKEGCAPLSWAAIKGRIKMVKYLLKKGAKIDQEDVNGRTALMKAIPKEGNISYPKSVRG
jgi:ankyrin repeat protein